MRIEATDRFVLGSTAVAVCVLLCGSTSRGSPPTGTTRGHGRDNDDNPTSRELWHLVITPLLSQAADGRRAGRHTQSEPASRRQDVLESSLPDVQRNATDHA